MARKDFAERFQDPYCQSCGRLVLSRDETRVIHDPRDCRAGVGVHYDRTNGGRWVSTRFDQYFEPRLLWPLYRTCNCGMVLPFCNCTAATARASHDLWLRETEALRKGEFLLLRRKYGPCICDEEGKAILNCRCEKWAAKRDRAIERLNRSIELAEAREEQLKAPIRKLIHWALS